MEIGSIKHPTMDLQDLGIENVAQCYYQLSPEELVAQTLARQQGMLADSGALAINTGAFTGRSPKDKYIVKDAITANTVYWNDFNIPVTPAVFDQLQQKIAHYLSEKEVWVRDSYACADQQYRINIRVITETPWASLFAHNMFLRPTEEELEYGSIEWTILQVPGFLANPAEDGTRQPNFTIVNFTKKMILIGGSSYTGEIKKGIFTILNYILPQDKNVLSMHCAANQGKDGHTAIFFGLSGTGKTTLSTDPARKLIGDDEHGWTASGVFNFEGGCYAKTIDLSADKEPQIFQAIREGALLENIGFYPGTRTVNFSDKSITENTRVSYPLHYIDNTLEPSIGQLPKNIFFLTCDAYGVLPPIAKLTPEQAMYQFISGYTARVAGTEAGVNAPKATFSACFGAPFLPLHPARYATMLGERMQQQQVNVWLVNTGWTGGPYGVGARMKLSHTRALISAALAGQLDNLAYKEDPLFGFAMPEYCPGVPEHLLDPRNTWPDATTYDRQAMALAHLFVENFEQYTAHTPPAILAAGPHV